MAMYETRPTIQVKAARFPTGRGWLEKGARVHLNANGSIEVGKWLGRFVGIYPTNTVEDGWRLFKCPGGGACTGHEEVCERHHKTMIPEKDWQRLVKQGSEQNQ
jgi:hypothetical protein